MRIGETMQTIGNKALTGTQGKLKPKTISEARDLVESGFKIQAKVLELETGPESLIPNGVKNNSFSSGEHFNESECIAEIESKLERFLTRSNNHRVALPISTDE